MNNIYYFINENIFTFNSGTEFSAMNRQKIFKKLNLKSKIITRNYNQGLHQVIRNYNLSDDDVLNMYDYFQKVIDIPYHHEKLRYSKVIDKQHYKIVGIDNNKSVITRHGNTVAEVNIFPGTIGEIGSINYLDQFGNTSSRDIWDARGFKSKTQYLHPDGRIGHEVIFDYQGNPVIEITHMNKDNDFPTMFKLLNYKGHNFRFDNEDALFNFFLREISDENSTVLINDRPTLTAVVAQVPNVKARYQVLHNEHTVKPKLADKPNGKLYPNLIPLFNQFSDQFNGIIVSTSQQKQDLNKFFPELNVIAIADTAIMHKHAPATTNEKNRHEITYLGRVFHDKHIDHLIKITEDVKKVVPDVHMNVVGYFESPAYKQELDEQIKKAKLTNNVTLTDYRIGKDRDNILANTQVLLQTSFGEGLSMTLVQGLAYGIPAVAYDVNYGPNQIIDNGSNGYLIPAGDKKKAAKAVENLITNQDLHAKFSQAALKKAAQFSAERIGKQWQAFAKHC
ncbi:glycosyltransferase [Apilactobacillus quenuiae]|uniref:glycosyltransferase n=1 Tax=Apilactobacillus quenuiae TaxID=2008377 RepID=UPI000D01F047|nr:glycosyltransferase [Apilactobacillus quenuiae]